MPSLALQKDETRPQRYPYCKLPGPDSIRLLHINQVEREDYVVYGSLQEVESVKDVAQEYLALSYTWGPAMMEGYESDEPFRPRFRLLLSPTSSELDKVTYPTSSEMEFRAVRVGFTTRSEIPLSQNLSDFFWTVDLSAILGAGDRYRPLWIDAVCTNQEDSIEVDEQVMLMGDIYGLCRNTLVWLGPYSHDLAAVEWVLGEAGEALMRQWLEESGNVEDAAEYIHQEFSLRVSKCCRVMKEELWNELDVKIPPLKIHHTVPGLESAAKKFARWNPGEETQISLSLVWMSWCRFFNSRAWFHRAWVMQEVANLSSVFVIAGTLQFSLERLFDMDRLLCWSGYYTIFTSVLAPSLQLEDTIHGPEHEMYLGWSRLLFKLNFPDQVHTFYPVGDWTLFSQVMEFLMRHASKKKSTFARDKYVCILGIARRTLCELQVPPLLADGLVIPPGATAPETFLYLQRLFRLANQSHSLSLLCLVHHSSNESMMATLSWVIDWSAQDAPDTFRGGRVMVGEPSYCLNGPQNLEFNLGPWEEMHCEITAENSLCVYALCLSKVTWSFKTRVSRVSHALSAVLEVLAILRPMYEKTGEPLEVALFAVMSASDSTTGFKQSVLENFCNVITNTTIVGLRSSLWDKGLNFNHPAAVESDIEYWLLSATSTGKWSGVEDHIRMDRFPKPGHETISVTSILIEALQRVESAIAMLISWSTHPSGEGLEVPEWMSNIAPWKPLESLFQEYQRRILRNRAVFVTDDGYLGLGPGIAQPGGQLCLIAGQSAPCILRPVPGTNGEGGRKYWFVGEAWVHGLMDGQGINEDTESQLKTVELV